MNTSEAVRTAREAKSSQCENLNNAKKWNFLGISQTDQISNQNTSNYITKNVKLC